MSNVSTPNSPPIVTGSLSSVYHYYVACQFKLSNPEFYLAFSMDSGNPISRSITKAREASDLSKETSLRNPDITADEDYYSGPRHLEELFYGTYANINQHEDLKRILINTRNAKLMRYVKKDNISKFVIDTDLIYIRFLLNNRSICLIDIHKLFLFPIIFNLKI